MHKVHVYPRGFMSGTRNDDIEGELEVVGKPTIIKTEGDPVIMALFNEYMAKASIRHSADFQLQVVTRFLQLIGDIGVWTQRQVARNRYLYDQNFEFLLDTFKFIHTGTRGISNLLTWYQIMNEHPAAVPGVTADRWNERLRKMSVHPTEDIIAKWLSHSTGFDDVMMTAFIMFGDSKTPLDKHSSLIT